MRDPSKPGWPPGPLLLFGGSGFLGPHLVASALSQASRAPRPNTEHEPSPGRESWARVVSASRQPIRGLGNERDHPALAFETIDLVDEAATLALLDRVAPSAIVYAAALARVHECEARPALAERLNQLTPGSCAAWAADRGAGFVYVSTDLVFAGEPPRESGYREDDSPAPLHVYGATKAAGEEAVLGAYAKALVCRLPLLFGDSNGRGMGASDALLAAVARGEVPTLFVDEWRTPLDVEEAADGVLQALRTGQSGRLHLAGASRVSRHELGLLVLRAAGFPHDVATERVSAVRSETVDLGAPRPADVSLDSSRARSLLGLPLRGAQAALLSADSDERSGS